MGKHPNPKPQTTRTQDPTQVLVGEGKRGKQRSQDPQMGTSLALGEGVGVLKLKFAKIRSHMRSQIRSDHKHQT